MSPRQQARLLERLEREHGPAVRRAFEKAIRDLRGRVDMGALQRAITAGDITAAVAAIGIAEPVFRDFEREITRAFEGTGRRFMDLFPKRLRDPRGAIVRLDFDIRHPEAERWLRREAAGLVTRIVEDQREAIREQLTDALQRGLNPRTSALDLVGRIDRSVGRRTGGIIGLSKPQAGYLRNARAYLEAGDARYFDMTLRDKRFDGAVRRAFEAGRAVPADVRERALTSYSNRLLRQRGEIVSRTETLNALRAGQDQAFSQGAEQAGVDDDLITHEWDASGDGRTRMTHAAADGQRIQGQGATFTVGGYAMRYPGDSSLGAPASETVACRCRKISRIDFIEQQARREGR